MNCLLVIPHYRHLDRLRDFLPGLASRLAPGIDIQISDDGSGAGVVRELTALLEQPAIAGRMRPPMLAAVNRGKGHAVYAAWRRAKDSDWLAFVDADGAIAVEEVNRAWKSLLSTGEPPGALIGSRVRMLGRKVRRSFYRHFAGRVFATLASTVSGLPVYDSQCGLKFVRRAQFEKIADLARAERFSFDVELLMLLAATGCRIEEFPVDWSDVPGGKVSVLRDAPQMVGELLATRRRLQKLR